MDEKIFKNLREKMVEEQIKNRGIKDKKVLEAMKKIPRHLFVPQSEIENAYEDYPLPIGEGQTISQPYIVALMTELLEVKETDIVLEIGTGSGYQTAILSRLANRIYTIERIPILKERAEKVINILDIKNVHFFIGNGWNGLKEYSPFDKIIVTAAAESVPEELKKQLKIGGTMVLPVGDFFSQFLYKIIKKDEKIFEKELIEAVRFVPLVKG